MCHFSWPHIRTYIHALSRRVSIAYIVTSAFSLILNLNSGHYAVLAVAVVRSYFRLKCIDNRIIKLKYRFRTSDLAAAVNGTVVAQTITASALVKAS